MILNPYLISAIVAMAAVLAAGFSFVFKKSHAERLFGFFWLCVGYWLFSVGFQFEWMERVSPEVWGWFLHVGCILVPVLFLHFSLVFSGRDAQKSILLKLSYGLAAVFVLLNIFTESFTHGTVINESYAYPKPAVLYPVYILFFQVMGIVSGSLLIKTALRLSGARRLAMWIFVATHVLAYVGCMDNFLIMYEFQIFPLYPYGLYALVPYALIGGYALSRTLKLDENGTA